VNVSPPLDEAAFSRSDGYDEMFDRTGTIRAHWKALADALRAMPPDDYRRRVESATRMVRENGVTYNAYDEAAGLERPWQLDIAPFIVSAEDWALIEAAVAQRARLVDALLRDIYGEQHLLRRGTVPAHLVLGHPQYLRTLQNVRPQGGVHVHLYSADLTRANDGSWTVLASRADVPTGIGYALENRIVVSQALPELFGDLGVQRLATFFRDFRASVAGLAREAGDHAVLLTPGPYNEAYFEHAFLARYLGLELVEGDDLSVRDGAVYLRTLGGLSRVSTIFRRLDSDFADPLEFRADSALGVPGLGDVIRAGNVVVANALGGGVVESPALDAYLPNVSRALFGEELLVDGPPTVWCGTAWGRSEGLARLRRSIVRNAFDARPLFSRGSTARLGAEMSETDVAAFADHLERRGATMVVHEDVPSNGAPTFEAGAFAMRPMSLRVFAAWTPSGYRVMPGGLARIAQDASPRALSMQSGAASKDVWALSAGPIDTFSLLPLPRSRVAIRRAGVEAPSRAMDNLFWLARYAERAENLTRLLRAVVLRLAGDTGLSATMDAVDLSRRLLVPLEHVSEEAIEAADLGETATLRSEVRAVIFGKELSGLQRLLKHVARTAWSARDRLSLDTWRAIHALTSWDVEDEPDAPFDGPAARAYLDMLVRQAAAVSGLSAENMTRGNDWLFFDLGRRVERVFSACFLVRSTFVIADEQESSAVQVALEIADSVMTYSYRYRNAFAAAPAADLLLLDPTNPRGVAFQVDAIVRHASDLPMIADRRQRGVATGEAERLQAMIRATEAYALTGADPVGIRTGLIAFLDEVEAVMSGIADAIDLLHLPRFRA
jgi:uncharacterized circularly permuted ATP-grasp superfamily protein/uncharacterized alpha-E superfamily protein